MLEKNEEIFSQGFLTALTKVYFDDLVLSGLETCRLSFSRKKLFKKQGLVAGLRIVWHWTT